MDVGEFMPDPPPTRMLEPGGSGIVLYPVPSGRRDRPDLGGEPGWHRRGPVHPQHEDAGWRGERARLVGGRITVVLRREPRHVRGRCGRVAGRPGRGPPRQPAVPGRRGRRQLPGERRHLDLARRHAACLLAPGRQRVRHHTIAVLDVASGQVTRLDSTRAPASTCRAGARWHAPGVRLPGTRPRADGICRVNVDGSGLRRILPAIAGDVSDLQWSPDGSSILFAVDGGGRAELFTIGSDGAGLRSLTQRRPPGRRSLDP